MDQAYSLIVRDTQYSLDAIIGAWLHAKHGRTGSDGTKEVYAEVIQAFRNTICAQGFDLDTPRYRDLALQAQWFAGLYWEHGQIVDKPVAPATYNQRLSILSSFYVYAMRMQFLDKNPINLVERRRTDEYASAVPLAQEEVVDKLAAINLSTKEGVRDYALLLVLFTCGRRLAEVQTLVWSQLHLTRKSLTVTFHGKGGKTFHDTLQKPVGVAVLQWLQLVYGPQLTTITPTSPIWVSVKNGEMLGRQGIAKICQRRLGTSKVHTTRHTFAHMMDALGAPVTDIQRALGHVSLDTTNRYVQKMRTAENPYGTALTAYLGLQNN